MKIISVKNHLEFIDMSRGFAIFLMFIYHFSFDLDYYGLIQQNFYLDDFWINFRLLIVTLFLTIMGISLYLASYKELNIKRFRQRILLLIIYSLLVTISSWVMYPQAMVFFGILHFITAASILGLLFIRLGIMNLFLGLSLIIAGQVWSHPFFDHPYLQWLGFVTKLPVTVDYVPLFPWFGVVLIGLYFGQIITKLPAESFLIRWKNKNIFTQSLAVGGQYSLHIYMLHQPLFLGILYIISQVLS